MHEDKKGESDGGAFDPNQTRTTQPQTNKDASDEEGLIDADEEERERRERTEQAEKQQKEKEQQDRNEREKKLAIEKDLERINPLVKERDYSRRSHQSESNSR